MICKIRQLFDIKMNKLAFINIFAFAYVCLNTGISEVSGQDDGVLPESLSASEELTTGRVTVSSVAVSDAVNGTVPVVELRAQGVSGEAAIVEVNEGAPKVEGDFVDVDTLTANVEVLGIETDAEELIVEDSATGSDASSENGSTDKFVDPRVGICTNEELLAAKKHFSLNEDSCDGYTCVEDKTQQFFESLNRHYAELWGEGGDSNQLQIVASLLGACACRCQMMKCEIDYMNRTSSPTCIDATVVYCKQQNLLFSDKCGWAADMYPQAIIEVGQSVRWKSTCPDTCSSGGQEVLKSSDAASNLVESRSEDAEENRESVDKSASREETVIKEPEREDEVDVETPVVEIGTPVVEAPEEAESVGEIFIADESVIVNAGEQAFSAGEEFLSIDEEVFPFQPFSSCPSIKLSWVSLCIGTILTLFLYT